jgi:diguanylate cyclase
VGVQETPVVGDHQSRRHDHEFDRLPQRTFRFRVLGMGLGALCIAAVLLENDASPLLWAMCAFTGLVWPHLAFHTARRSRSPYRAELRNLLLDSAQAALWVPLMQFNLLPSVLLLTLVTVDKISAGVPRLWVWSLPAMAAGMLCGGLATGFAFSPETSMRVTLACLPMLLIHTTAVALASSRLVHKVREKNRQLDELSRIDSLTGLYIRRHWQILASHCLAQHHGEGVPMTLAMLDVDYFKVANDRHGHSVGDDVLRSVAKAIRANLREGDCAGRYGGDEFGIVFAATDADAALTRAGDILRAVRAIILAGAPGVQVTASIGIAQAGTHPTLQQWIEDADAALYRAKRAGRDRVVVSQALAQREASHDAVDCRP